MMTAIENLGIRTTPPDLISDHISDLILFIRKRYYFWNKGPI